MADENLNDEEERDDEVAPEVPTSFATKGVGWSGREKEGPEVIDLNKDSPSRSKTWKRSS
ncbi:MAG: hypothetical protein ACR2HM_05895 [Acidimicrobiales bacterium]